MQLPAHADDNHDHDSDAFSHNGNRDFYFDACAWSGLR